MRNTAIAALLLLAAPLAFASGFKKAYFGATKPGSWAKYAMHTSAGDITFTSTRLSDDAGQPRIEIKTEFADKTTPTAINRYTLKKGFDIDHSLMDYGPAIVDGEMGVGDEIQKTDPATLAAISKTLARYGENAKFVGSETVNGKKCDHYSYTVRFEGDPAQIETGDLWLNDSVPFGLVKQKASTTDEKGNDISSYEENLTDSGSGK